MASGAICEKTLERARHVIVPFGPLALARAGNVKDGDVVVADKVGDDVRAVFGRELCSVDELMRPLLFKAEADCLLSAATKLAGVNNDSSIRIFHVLQRAFRETTGFQFLKRILIRNQAKFVKPSGGTPSAAFDSVLERDIERRAINACLPAGNYFQSIRYRRWC